MAVVRPLFYDNGNIKQMSDSQITDLKSFCLFKYGTAGSVTLGVDSGNTGNLSAISDTRLQAGSQSTSATAFPNEATTAEPSVVTVSYQRVQQNLSTVHDVLGVDGGNRYPCYLDENNNIRAMNAQDMKDTLIHPAFDILFSTDITTQQNGTYFVSTTNSPPTGAVLASSNALYTDTRANAAAYTSGSIPESLDQPTNIQSYYLMKNEMGSNPVPNMTKPLKINDFNNIQEYPDQPFDQMIENFMGHTAKSSPDGYTLRYTMGTTGGGGTYTKGSGIADTRLNGSGNYQTRFVNADDYRAQEFPNGTATTVSTYYLRIVKA